MQATAGRPLARRRAVAGRPSSAAKLLTVELLVKVIAAAHSRTSRRAAAKGAKNASTPLALVNTIQSEPAADATERPRGTGADGGAIAMVGNGITSAPLASSWAASAPA